MNVYWFSICNGIGNPDIIIRKCRRRRHTEQQFFCYLSWWANWCGQTCIITDAWLFPFTWCTTKRLLEGSLSVHTSSFLLLFCSLVSIFMDPISDANYQTWRYLQWRISFKLSIDEEIASVFDSNKHEMSTNVGNTAFSSLTLILYIFVFRKESITTVLWKLLVRNQHWMLKNTLIGSFVAVANAQSLQKS